jgi:hypothetical protein
LLASVERSSRRRRRAVLGSVVNQCLGKEEVECVATCQGHECDLDDPMREVGFAPGGPMVIEYGHPLTFILPRREVVKCRLSALMSAREVPEYLFIGLKGDIVFPVHDRDLGGDDRLHDHSWESDCLTVVQRDFRTCEFPFWANGEGGRRPHLGVGLHGASAGPFCA